MPGRRAANRCMPSICRCVTSGNREHPAGPTPRAGEKKEKQRDKPATPNTFRHKGTEALNDRPNPGKPRPGTTAGDKSQEPGEKRGKHTHPRGSRRQPPPKEPPQTTSAQHPAPPPQDAREKHKNGSPTKPRQRRHHATDSQTQGGGAGAAPTGEGHPYTSRGSRPSRYDRAPGGTRTLGPPRLGAGPGTGDQPAPRPTPAAPHGAPRSH